MTASKTPNMGLLYPTGTDPFLTSDFADTMAILDQHPGTLTVPNQAGRPNTWGVNQHGRRVMQADQQIEWMWYQPSAPTPGVWKRTYAKGMLATSQTGGTVSTSNQNYNSPATLVQLTNVLIPGGRPYKIKFWAEWWQNTAGVSIATVFENGTMLSFYHVTGRTFGQHPYPGVHGLEIARPAPASQVTITFKLGLSSHTGFGGSCLVFGPALEVEEY
jgi:hypothetical protein